MPRVGTGRRALPSNDAARKTYILVNNRLVALPDGLMFLVPTKLVPTALTRLFSFSTKLRMALELLHPPRPTGLPDEAVAALVERHFGAEAVDRLADPLLSGIYGGDAAAIERPHRPARLVEMETQYGSLTRGMLAAHRQMRAKRKSRRKKMATQKPADRPRRGPSLRRCAAECSSWSTPLRRGSIRPRAPGHAGQRDRKTASGWSCLGRRVRDLSTR